jgi:hypothetical protein
MSDKYKAGLYNKPSWCLLMGKTNYAFHTSAIQDKTENNAICVGIELLKLKLQTLS